METAEIVPSLVLSIRYSGNTDTKVMLCGVSRLALISFIYVLGLCRASVQKVTKLPNIVLIVGSYLVLNTFSCFSERGLLFET
jgi:hypothetical protein